MKQIYGIAKAELQVLFFSPIAWFILIVFMVQSSMSYFGTVGSFASTVADGGHVSDVTYKLFVQQGMSYTLFPSVLGYLFYYIPLLTMGIMSRELSSGSIKLLYASPVSNTQIVIGKFAAIAIYGLLMIGVLLLLVFQGAFMTPDNFDWGFIPISLLGVFLLICAYGAVGLFMSSLSSYQMVAMLSTLVVLTFFNYVGTFGQDIAFVREITYWLSINGRAMLFAKGVFCTEDFLYFLTVIFLFLSLTILRLIVKRENISRSMVLCRYLAIFGVVIIVAFVSSRPQMKYYLDATRFQRHTLTKSSQDIISEMEGKYKITTYANIFDDFPIVARTIPRRELDDINILMSPYTRFKPDIKLEYKYYAAPTGGTYDYYMRFMGKSPIEDIIAKQVKNLGMTEDRLVSYEELAKIEPIIKEENYKTVKVIEGPDGKKGIIRYFSDMTVAPTEAEISAAFKRMITDEYPKVAFITGHGERSIFNDGDLSYTSFTSKYVRASLYNQGYDVVESTFDKPIAEDVNILVIADPRELLSENELANYKKYIERDGNLIVLGEPMRKDKTNNLMELFGYKLADGVLVKPVAGNRADIIAQKPTTEGNSISYFIDQLYHDSNKKISTPSTTYLEKIADSGFNERVVIASDLAGGNIWNELQTRYFEESEPEFNPESGEQIMDKAPIAIAFDREVKGKAQKVLLVADADIFSNQEMGLYPHTGIRADNPKFITGVFEWMSDGVSPIDMRRPAPIDNNVKISVDGASRVKFFFMWGIPLLILVFGLVINIRRRAK